MEPRLDDTWRGGVWSLPSCI